MMLTPSIRKNIGAAMMTSMSRGKRIIINSNINRPKTTRSLLLSSSSFINTPAATTTTTKLDFSIDRSRSFSTDLKVQPKEGANDNVDADADASKNVDNDHANSSDESSSSVKPIRLLPTRHSKHHAPQVAPVKILHNATAKTVNSKAGTLFVYNGDFSKLSKLEEYEKGLEVSNYHQQHVEYLLRGYSSLLPSSIVHLQSSKSNSSQLLIDNKPGIKNIANENLALEKEKAKMNQEEIVNKMIQLVERMEKEGQVYVKTRSTHHSQLAKNNEKKNQSSNNSNNNIATKSSITKDEEEEDYYGDDDATEKNKQQWQTSQLINSYGAPPGPSSNMYDLTLDAIANIIPQTSNPVLYLQKACTLFKSAWKRNELDQKQELDLVNVDSIPTAATFNALIRISALVGDNNDAYKTNNPDVVVNDEEVRDIAIANAFIAFDAACHHNVVERNSATFKYMIQTVNKFFPDCEAKGYILVTIWDKCIENTEGVLDAKVVQSMLDVNSKECGEKFHDFVMDEIKNVYNPDEKNGFGFPMKLSKNKNLRRFDKRLDVY